MKPLRLEFKDIKWDELAVKGGSTMKALSTWEGATCGICVPYACGECPDPNCTRDHGKHHELPPDWITRTLGILRKAVGDE